MGYYAAFGTIWIAVHLLGIAASWMVRIELGGRIEVLARTSFLVCMPIVALTTIVGYHFCSDVWPLSAVTLSLMIVMAVFDCDPHRSMPASVEV